MGVLVSAGVCTLGLAYSQVMAACSHCILIDVVILHFKYSKAGILFLLHLIDAFIMANYEVLLSSNTVRLTFLHRGILSCMIVPFLGSAFCRSQASQ